MWRQAYQALKAASPTQTDPVIAKTAAVKPTISSALGWRDHYRDQQKAQLKSAFASTVAAHLTDNADHQTAIAGAINGMMSSGAASGTS